MITPVGLDTETSWQGLINGKSGIGPITQFDDKAIPTQIAGEIHGFEPEKFTSLKKLRNGPFHPFCDRREPDGRGFPGSK
jgi:3-oxoacyl-[acyl-carrier-protein] synthase II